MRVWWNGIHACLRNKCRKACRFDSCYPYVDNREQQKFSQVPLAYLLAVGLLAGIVFAAVLLLWML